MPLIGPLCSDGFFHAEGRHVQFNIFAKFFDRDAVPLQQLASFRERRREQIGEWPGGAEFGVIAAVVMKLVSRGLVGGDAVAVLGGLDDTSDLKGRGEWLRLFS